MRNQFEKMFVSLANTLVKALIKNGLHEKITYFYAKG